MAHGQSADELRGATDGDGSAAFGTLNLDLLLESGFVAIHLRRLHRVDDVDVPLLGSHAGFDQEFSSELQLDASLEDGSAGLEAVGEEEDHLAQLL